MVSIVKGAACLVILAGSTFAAKKDLEDLQRNASTVLNEVAKARDGIPEQLLARAQCFGVVPQVPKSGFTVGGKVSKGILTCRTQSGWSAPAFIQVEGGNSGQVSGGGERNIVFLVMRKSAQDKLGGKFTLGGDAYASAGPVGREHAVDTDSQMNSGILVYSVSQGSVAGLNLEGATIRVDAKDNEELYGASVTLRDILSGSTKSPIIFQEPPFPPIKPPK